MSAFKIVGEVLVQAPKLPEALYLKAQILWEGYQDASAARELLLEVIDLVPDAQQTYHRWAQSLLQKIIKQTGELQGR